MDRKTEFTLLNMNTCLHSTPTVSRVYLRASHILATLCNQRLLCRTQAVLHLVSMRGFHSGQQGPRELFHRWLVHMYGATSLERNGILSIGGLSFANLSEGQLLLYKVQSNYAPGNGPLEQADLKTNPPQHFRLPSYLEDDNDYWYWG